MSIISLSFFALIIVALLFYYILPKCCQWIVLLITSIIFFCLACTPWTIVYLFVGILITYLATLRISSIRKNVDKYSEKEIKVRTKIWLTIALVLDLGMLVALKYMNFILGNSAAIFNLFSSTKVSWSVNWPAALGISYYTLQIVGYLLDCYWGICEPQKNFGKFALFACFFPQMTSGPINRYSNLGEELNKSHKFDISNLYIGIIRILIGLFKKVVVADGFATLTQYIVGPQYTFIILLLYVVRIYADFSGCMDIVIGCAKCFGINMVENFKTPFLSRSIQEFWQRWHITLGLWLRDYVMYPILRIKLWRKMTKTLKAKVSKRASKLIPTHLAMLILWFFMGLWHGGGWNFILEGIWFWLVIVISEWCAPLFKKITSKFDTENPFWIFFQRGRTLLIYAIGALMFKSSSMASFFETLILMLSGYQFYAILFAFILFCMISGLFYKLLKNYPKRQTLYKIYMSTVMFLIAGIIVLIVLLNFFKGLISSFVLEIIEIVGISYLLFLFFTHVESKQGGFANRTLTRPVVYKILLIILLIYMVATLGFYKSGYNAADFIYGGF